MIAARSTADRPGRSRRAAGHVAAFVLAVGAALAAPWLRAAELPRPTGRVILTVVGEIERSNAPGRAEFDYAMLAELGLVTRTVATPWTDPGTRFEGVPARALLERVGADGRWAVATAANDYRIDIPLDDLTEHDTLLALSKDGRRMPLRDKGPVWILYDDVDRPDIDEEDLRARMVWQLKTLEIVD